MKKILLLLLSFTAFAADITLLSLQGNAVETGDIVTFKIQSEYDFNYLKKYKNQRVGNILYLLDITKEGDDFFARGILAERSQKEKKSNLQDKFFIRNLDYRQSKLKMSKDFIIYNGPEVNLQKYFKKYSLYVIILFFVIVVLLSISFYIKKKRIKKKLIEEQVIFLNLLKNSKTKSDLELVYLKRKEFSTHLSFDSKSFEDFLVYLNTIQYKEKWTKEEEMAVFNLFKRFKKNLRTKNGI